MGVRNVLLITVDSLRYDRALGDEAAGRAPTLAGLADEGVSFDEAVANGPNTPSSFPSILTGTHPLMYGGYRYLDERRPFLSETFRSAGYHTVGYHSNPHLGSEKNYHHGFDSFNDGGGDESDDGRTLKNLVDRYVDPDSILYRLLRRGYHLFQMTADTSAYARAPEITARATDWFDKQWDGDRPFFMWLHYMDVHYPFAPPDEFVEELGHDPISTRRKTRLNGLMQEDPDELTEADRRDLLALYDGEIRYTDHHVGRLLSDLDDRGVREDTAVVLTADHGEAFGEHGRYGHHPYLYDELVRVPLVMDVPGVEASRVEHQMSLIDVGPTVLDLCGIEVPEAVQGRSRRPLLAGEATGDAGDPDDEVAICTSRGGEMLATRTPAWKCLWDRDVERIELYDLVADPGETDDQSEDHPDVVERFRGIMEEHLVVAEATRTDLPDVEESEEVKRRLEDLGYVD